MAPREVHRDLQLKVAEAALARSARASGVTVDMYGFRFGTTQELLCAIER